MTIGGEPDTWTLPGIPVSNEEFGHQDQSNAISRRTIVIQFTPAWSNAE